MKATVIGPIRSKLIEVRKLNRQIAELRVQKEMNTGWQEGKNLDTTQEGYHIRHAGSLMASQCNSQNTIEEMIALSKEYTYEPFTYCKKYGEKWYFRGNFRELSNVFDVVIWKKSIALKAQRSILNNH